MSEVCYVSPDAPSLALSVRVGDNKAKTRVKFLNKQLRLDDEKDAALIEALDELLATRPSVATLMYKVDVAAAEQLAFKHKESLLRMRGTVSGPVSADDAKRAAAMAIQERDADLAAQGASISDLSDMRAEMSKDGLELTENSKGVVAPQTRDGFVETKGDAPLPLPTQEDATPEPKQVFANLGKK